MKAIFCTPSLTGVTAPYVEALKASIPLIKAAGWEEGWVQEIGCPYISNARATMLRKALDAKADVIVFIDYDVSWQPADLLTLINTPGEVVAGTYRFKKDEVEYMGSVYSNEQGTPLLREDGCIESEFMPAGFLKITPEAVDRFITKYPDLTYGSKHSPHVDIFNHGAMDGRWFGEDYGFCKHFREAGGKVWCLPDLNISHHSAEQEYKGNFHEYLLRQPGGSEHGNSSECN